MLAQLGDLRFEPAPLERIERTAVFGFAQQTAAMRKASLQAVGDGLVQLSLTLVFHERFCNPRLELGRLRIAAAAKASQLLVLGNGEVVGRFVITEVADTAAQTAGDGSLIEARVRISLLESVEPVVLEIERPPRRTGPAISKSPAQPSAAVRQAPPRDQALLVQIGILPAKGTVPTKTITRQP